MTGVQTCALPIYLPQTRPPQPHRPGTGTSQLSQGSRHAREGVSAHQPTQPRPATLHLDEYDAVRILGLPQLTVRYCAPGAVSCQRAVRTRSRVMAVRSRLDWLSSILGTGNPGPSIRSARPHAIARSFSPPAQWMNCRHYYGPRLPACQRGRMAKCHYPAEVPHEVSVAGMGTKGP